MANSIVVTSIFPIFILPFKYKILEYKTSKYLPAKYWLIHILPFKYNRQLNDR